MYIAVWKPHPRKSRVIYSNFIYRFRSSTIYMIMFGPEKGGMFGRMLAEDGAVNIEGRGGGGAVGRQSITECFVYLTLMH